MYHSVGAVASAGSSPIVRIAAAEPYLIKRALDSGAHGIMVPMCETKVRVCVNIFLSPTTLVADLSKKKRKKSQY